MDAHPLGLSAEDYPLAIEIARSTSEPLREVIVDALRQIPYVGEIRPDAAGWMHPTSENSVLLAELHIADLSLWPRKPGLAVMAGGWSFGVFDQEIVTGFVALSTGRQEQIKNPPVNSRTVVLRTDPESSQVIQAVHDWLSEFAPDRPSETDRLLQLRNRVEQLIRELHLRILENSDLWDKLEEADLLIDQLRAQVTHLEAELRRRRLAPQRVGLPVAIIKYLLGPTAIAAAGGFVGVQAAHPQEAPPPHVVVVDSSAEQLRVVRSVCNQVLIELERGNGG